MLHCKNVVITHYTSGYTLLYYIRNHFQNFYNTGISLVESEHTITGLLSNFLESDATILLAILLLCTVAISFPLYLDT